MKTTKTSMDHTFEDTEVVAGHRPSRLNDRVVSGDSCSLLKQIGRNKRLWQSALAGFLILIGVGSITRIWAQSFDLGSNGSMGPLEVSASTTLPLPPDGIFHFTTITIAGNAILTFTPNALNTPVYLLATSNITIIGGIDVSGQAGNLSSPGLPGPGAFGGGHPGTPTSAPGDGLGPGGGRGGRNCDSADCAGSGSYGSVGTTVTSTNNGSIYGSALLIPLVGGSGGGGGAINGGGGGGGGGAILIGSNTRITFSSRDNRGIRAEGGAGNSGSWNGGSGGAIRLVAPVITGGEPNLSVNSLGGGGIGRVRIDTLDRTGATVSGVPASANSHGKVMSVFGPVQSRLTIVSAAGQNIPEGANSPVTIMLPFGSETNQVVRIQARDFAGVVPINIIVTPQNGSRRVFPAQIDMSAGNPAFANVPVTIPLNTEAAIHAWTR